MTAFSCPNCRGLQSDTLLSKSGYEIVRCSQCGLQAVKTMPEPEVIMASYQRPEYYAGSSEGYHDYMGMAKVMLPLAERRLIQIEKTLPAETKQPRILDVGCAAGFFLERARARGWEISGVEVAAQMSQNAQRRLGIPIYASIESLKDEAVFDAITFWEVIEHLPDPHSILRQMFRLLKPAGILALSTPNTGHWQAIEDPGMWTSYCPPIHLLFFTRASLKATLETAGFEIVSVDGAGPLPRLPAAVQRLLGPMRQGLSEGNARHWTASLYAWRAVRLLALMRDRLFASQDDAMMTLEAVARKPAR